MFNSIRARLSLLVVLGLIAVLAVSLMGAFNARNDTIELKKRELHARVQIATTLIEHYVAQAASGAMSTKQAQKAAKQAVAALRYGSNGYYWIQDMTPTMVMHPIKPGLDGKPLGEIKDVTGSRFFVQMAKLVHQQPQGGVVTYHFPKPGAKTASKKFSYVMPVPEWGWVVGTGEYFDDVNAMTWHMLERALVIAVIAAIIYSLLAFLLNRSIARPLRSLGRAMHAISTGRADLTQRMPDFRLQEVRTLSEAYNRFMDKLDALVSRLKRSTSTLHEAGQTILQETAQLHDGMDRQKAETDQVVVATNEMSASIDEVAQGANHAANNATEMRQSTRDGQTTMQALSQAMTRVDQTIETAFSAISGARTDAEQINRVLDVISEISQQTNLLSLNAAIEAARAGEHGRGFAVVADEVRQLAIKTQQSIAEIQQIIEKLQSGVNTSADTMDQGRRVVSAAIDQNGAVLTAFEDIAVRAEEMSNLNDQTASAVEEQSAVVREIDRKITEINSVTENSFAVAEQIHAAIREIKGLSEHLSDEVAELRTSADS